MSKLGLRTAAGLRLCRRGAFWVQRQAVRTRNWLPLFLLMGGLAGSLAAEAATIWTGPAVVFTKGDGADPTQASNQDRLT